MQTDFSASSQRSQGSVVVVVLGLVMLAAFFLSQFIERSMTEMLVESRARQAERLRAQAHSALEASLAVLAEYQALDGGLRAPEQGWGQPLAGLDFFNAEDTLVTVEIEDESGRLSLPRIRERDLVAWGRASGLKETEATRLADAFLTWTRRDHSSPRVEADPRNYEYEDPPHRPPGRPIESFAELAAIAGAREFFYQPDGQPTSRLEDLRRNVSLHDFPVANLNAASPATLLLAGLDQAQVDLITDYRAGKGARPAGAPPYFRSMAEVKSLLGPTALLAGFDTLARCLRLRVSVQEGSTAFHLTAAVAPAIEDVSATGLTEGLPDLRYPFRVLAYEENIELAAAPIRS